MNYEAMLFEVAPWTREVMGIVKTFNDGNFLNGRTGWVRRDIENPESNYEHSCKMGLASYYLFGTKEAVDGGISHDFPELIEPDYVPGEITKIEKRKNERIAMKHLSTILPNGDYWLKMWENYERKIGISQQIGELDKICPCIQAIDYQRKYKNHNLEEFYPYARKKVLTHQLIDLLDEMNEMNISESVNPYEVYFDKLKKIRI